MKLKITFIIAILSLGLTMNAQTKVGTVNSELIISKMPQLKVAQERVNNYAKKLDSTFNIKVKSYEALVAEYNKASKTISEAGKKIKLNELTILDQDLKKFQENGSKILNLRRGDFMRPLYKKVSDIITQIAKEKGYTQVLTTSGNEFAYIDPKFDITKLVLAKMGIKE